MRILTQHLGCDVLRSALVCRGHLVTLQDPRHAEVNQLQVAILAHHNVLKLQVAMNNVQLVQLADANDDLGNVELDVFFGELTILLQ